MVHTLVCFDETTLDRLLHGPLEDDEASRLEEHLLVCDTCLGKVRRLGSRENWIGVLRNADLSGRSALQPIANSEFLGKLKQLRSTTPEAGEHSTIGPGGHSSQAVPLTPGVSFSRPKSGTDEDHECLSPPQLPDEIGRLGSYRVLKVLGAGGMGVVFKAEDPSLRRLVALKVMRGKTAQTSAGRERFLREAQAAAAIRHDHIVTIYQVGEENGTPFIALEFLEGQPLDQWLEAHPRPTPQQITHIGREIAEGLAAAHAKNLVHRDIKPANIWLEFGREPVSNEGSTASLATKSRLHKFRVKILDFGLARPIADTNLTSDGQVIGTPAYMSPEQARGLAVDHRTDLFSLGVLLYRLAAGETPFKGADALAMLTSLAVDEPTPVVEMNRFTPPALADLIHRLLRKQPDERPATANDVADELRDLEREMNVPIALVENAMPTVEERPIAREPKSRWPVAIAGAALAAAIVIAMIVIRIKNKDGTETVIQVPEGAKVSIEDRDGKAKVANPPHVNGVARKIPPSDTAVNGNEVVFDLGNGITLQVIEINAKGKTFQMGSPIYEAKREADEGQHDVTFANDFAIGKYEVTQEQYEAIMKINPSKFQGATRPVEMVSWNEAVAFIKILNEKFADRKVIFRLPSEAEWEYACRAGTTTAFHTGATLEATQARFDIREGGTVPVGSYKPNAFGLYDMHGNVKEWCEDTHMDYKDAPNNGAPQLQRLAKDNRVLRGGGWINPDSVARSADRRSGPPSGRWFSEGFRVAMSRTEVAAVARPPVPAPSVNGSETTYDLGNGVMLETIKIASKGKTFQMGSPGNELDRRPNEDPHPVTFGHDFSIGKFEVTQAQYEAVMKINPAFFKDPKKPVEMVSWEEAVAFTKKLNERFQEYKVTFRLPSEAEWEYACRAGTTTPFSFGKVMNGTQANCSGNAPYGTTVKGPNLQTTTQVAQYEANDFGLYDMHGNVWEWCTDYYGDYKSAPNDGTAQYVKQTDDFRVARGGSCGYGPKYCRAASRDVHPPGSRGNNFGFRVVVSEGPLPAAVPKVIAPSPAVKGNETTYDLGNGIKLEMVKIDAKGQSFLMGSPMAEPDRNPFEKAFDAEQLHEVTFGHNFAMGKYEVTQEQYEAMMGANPSKYKGLKRPVEHVAWDDAQTFISKLNVAFKDRKVMFRLPSEAEWEFACRAGMVTSFHTGKDLTKQDANFDGSSEVGTTPVGSYRPNAFGLYDMHGNVWEWCEDQYGSYGLAPKNGTAQNNQFAKTRVLRGGLWADSFRYCRSAYRTSHYPTNRSNFYGLRLAVTLAEEDTKTPDFVPLFNGKDLTGWTVDGGDAKQWKIENKAIVATSASYKSRNYILSEKDYSDFILRFEFQAGHDGAHGGGRYPRHRRRNGAIERKK